MLKKKNYLNYLLILVTFFLITCSSNNKNKVQIPKKVPSLDLLYNSAIDYYEKGKWNDAIDLFQSVEKNYSYSEWAPQSTLMLMHIYNETGDRIRTLEYAKKFLKLYPSHKNIDYVHYMVAMTFYEEINVISRDQTNTKIAQEKFNEFLKKYPKTIYAEDIKLKLLVIKEQLAGKEMYLARYYIKKSKWPAAIKRLIIVVDEYDDTIFVKEALHRLVEVYYKLGNINEAKKYAAILGYNYNDDKWYKKSYEILSEDAISEKKTKGDIKIKKKILNILKIQND